MTDLSRDDAHVLPALRLGSTGPRVSAWQTFLRGRGFFVGAVDGSFGRLTATATTEFQRRAGLVADGVAGRQTLLKAASFGFELFEEPSEDNSGSDWPSKPAFPPLTGNAARAAVFGRFDYVSAPTPRNPEAIRILGDWATQNIVFVELPELARALPAAGVRGMHFHRLAARQLQALWAAWDDAGLLDRILSFDGAFVARFVRGSRVTLSNHAFGSAFDINARWNGLGVRPALVGQRGAVRELVRLANAHGFYWGGHFAQRPDGMHFEVAVLK